MSLRRLGAVAIGVVLAAAAAELILVATGLGATPATKIALIDSSRNTLRFHCYSSQPKGSGFVPVPALDPEAWTVIELQEPPVRVGFDALARRPWCVEYQYGAPGVRGPAPSHAAFRIAGVGDSFAFGEGVPFERTLFAQLSQQLGTGIDVLNCAQSGADLELDVETLEWAAAAYRCPRALLVVTLNDVAPPAGGVGSTDLINVRGSVPPVLAWSRLATLVHGLVAGPATTRATIDAYRRAHDPAVNAAGLAAAESLFRRVAARSDCRTAVVIYPLLYGLDGTYPFAAAHAEVVRRAEAAGLPVLDLAPAFAGRAPEELHVHPVDHHPNGVAHELAAGAIAEWLRDAVPGFLPR